MCGPKGRGAAWVRRGGGGERRRKAVPVKGEWGGEWDPDGAQEAQWQIRRAER
jgi:hypothetical protein